MSPIRPIEKASQSEKQSIRRQAKSINGPRLVREDERGVHCMFCPSAHFRRSKLRSEDFLQILTLRYPVRCLRCSQRQYASYTVAGMSTPAAIKHRRLPNAQETWKGWTGAEAEANSHAPAPKEMYTPHTTMNVRRPTPAPGKQPAVPTVPRRGVDDDAIW